MARPESAVSLYLHVPFCTDKCVYCDFYSVPCRTVAEDIQARVVEETIRQARAILSRAPVGTPVQTIFVGGGTPSALPPFLQEKLLGAFTDLHPDEWTVEANPETLDEPFLERCRAAGVSRLSVGIQTLRQDLLDRLHRRATREDCLRAVRLLQERWTGRLSLDFIAGIPGQRTEDVHEDLAVVERDWPGHVSLYQLTREEGTPMDRMVDAGQMRMNPRELDEELWFTGSDEIRRRGYGHYEVSSFSRPGEECLHNLRYWSIEPYVGAGPAAVGTLPGAWLNGLTGFGSAGTVARLSNPRDIRAYLARAGAGWGAALETIAPEDFLVETFMMGLRTARGIPAEAVRRRFGAEVDALWPGLWNRWVSAGWALPATDSLRLTEDGMMLLDTLVEELIGARRTHGAGLRGGRDIDPVTDIRLSWP